MATTPRPRTEPAEPVQVQVLSGDVFTTHPTTRERVILAKGTVPPPEFADFLADKPHLFEDAHLEVGNYATGGPGGFTVLGTQPRT